MDVYSQTPLARVLAAPDPVTTFSDLARQWHDMRLRVVLADAACAYEPGFGNHVRRSFLGALGPGASPQARLGQPCSWDPPCTLDVFGREQLRGASGDGLPKPFALYVWPEGDDLCIELTVFGMACDWLHAAAEALGVGLLTILPWARVTGGKLSGPPQIKDRFVTAVSGLNDNAPSDSFELVLDSGLDASGRAGADPSSLLAAALRRVDAVARWQNCAVAPETGRGLAEALRHVGYEGTSLRKARIEMPNRHKQARSYSAVEGVIKIQNAPSELWPALRIAERCQIGRGTVWGLGRFSIGLGERRAG